MNRIKIVFNCLIVGSMLLAACNFPLGGQAQSEEDEENALQTAVALTVSVIETPTPLPPDLPTPQAGEPLQTPAAPSSDTKPAVPAPTSQPCKRAVFVRETVPDDTQFDGGQSFTKSWTFKNEGSCTWNSNYRLVFDSGDAMSAPASVSLPRSITPGQEVTIEVPMKAPSSSGTYTGFWRMQSEDGDKFAQVFVRIQTRSPLFAVTGVRHNLKVVSPDICPYTYPVEITITTSAAGTVTYKTETSNGGESSTRSINFDAAGSRTVKFDWSGLGEPEGTTQYELRVYIDKPNNQWFGPYRLNVTCP